MSRIDAFNPATPSFDTALHQGGAGQAEGEQQQSQHRAGTADREGGEEVE